MSQTSTTWWPRKNWSRTQTTAAVLIKSKTIAKRNTQATTATNPISSKFEDESGERVVFRNPGEQQDEDANWSKITLGDWRDSRAPSQCQPRMAGEIVPLRKAQKSKGNTEIVTPTWKKTLLEKAGSLEASPSKSEELPLDSPLLIKKNSQKRDSVVSNLGQNPKCLKCPYCSHFEFTRLHRQ